MCCCTAELAALLDPDRVTALDRVDGSTHAWNERRAVGLFCDPTGDQLARPAVQLRVGRPPAHVEPPQHFTITQPTSTTGAGQLACRRARVFR